MNDALWQVIIVSLKVASCASVLVMISSTLLALLLVKYPSKWLKTLELLIYVPMAMPPIAVGFGLLILLGPNSSVGSFLHNNLALDIAFTQVGAVLAAFIVSFGIGLRAMRVAFEEIDPLHQQRATLMGAHALEVFYYITFPLCRRSAIGAFILVFIRSLGEFGATMVLAGNNPGTTRTLALAIWTNMQTPELEQECLMLVILCALISFIALLGSEIILKKGFK